MKATVPIQAQTTAVTMPESRTSSVLMMSRVPGGAEWRRKLFCRLDLMRALRPTLAPMTPKQEARTREASKNFVDLDGIS